MEAVRRRPAVGYAVAIACLLSAQSAWRSGVAWLGGSRCRGALSLAPFRSSPAAFGAHRQPRLGRRGRRRGKRAPESGGEEEWKVRRGKAPAAVQDLVSSNFLRNLRDGGPQARQSEDLPPIDPAWIGASAEETARNVVGALCRHHYGDTVCVDEVLAGTDCARGRDYTVTLALSDRHVFGSCHSTQIGDFDRDTTALLEGLRKLDGWDQRIYKLKVQTPGTDRELAVPEDLWKCELLPCRVHWERDGKRQCRYLHRVPDANATWQLSECGENYQGGRIELTEKQRKLRYTIEDADLVKVSINIDSRSLKKLQRAKAAKRRAGEGDVQEALRQLGAEAPEEEEEEPEGASEEGELEEEAADVPEDAKEGGTAAEEEVLDVKHGAEVYHGVDCTRVAIDPRFEGMEESLGAVYYNFPHSGAIQGFFDGHPMVNWRHENLMRLFFRALRSFVKVGGSVKVSSNMGATGVRYSYIVGSALENEFVHTETVPFLEWHLHRYGRSYGDKRDIYKRPDAKNNQSYNAQAADRDMVYCFKYQPSGKMLPPQTVRLPPTLKTLSLCQDGPFRNLGDGARQSLSRQLHNRFVTEVSGTHVG